MSRKGTTSNGRLQQGGIVQPVRTPNSHREQQIIREISTEVAVRGAVEIAASGLRIKLSSDSMCLHPHLANAELAGLGADGGSIINLGSIVGSHPVAGALLYAPTIGAIETLTKGFALEIALARSGSTTSLRAIQKSKAVERREPLRVVPAPF